MAAESGFGVGEDAQAEGCDAEDQVPEAEEPGGAMRRASFTVAVRRYRSAVGPLAASAR